MSNDFEMEDVEDGEEVVNVTLRFVANKLGVITAPDSAPKLDNPQSSYGVSVVDTGTVIVAAATNMTADGSAWKYVFALPEGHDRHTVYRYYVKVIMDGVTYYLPRTTAYVKSACLVLGRYTNSFEIEQRFGVDSLHKWLGIDEHDEAVDYASRLYGFIQSAENEIDDALRDGGSVIPFTDVPTTIRELATDYSTVKCYESRGIADADSDTGNRLRSHRKRAFEQIVAIRAGSMRLATDDAIRYPRVITDCSRSTLDSTY